MHKLCFLFLFSFFSNLSYGQFGYGWTQKSNFPGSARYSAIAFTIGLKAYVGTGFFCNVLNDIWEYDPAIDVWTQKVTLPGLERDGAVCFSLLNKGYVGTGACINGTVTNDFWEFDPVANTWTSKSNFGSWQRAFGFSFTIGSKGYIGGGGNIYNSVASYNDLWEYDSVNDTWTQKINYPSGRYSPIYFSSGSKGYAGCGYTFFTLGGFVYYHDFWEYDPVVNIWTQKASFPGKSVFGTACFYIDSIGYVVSGADSNHICNNEFWEYNIAADSWVQKSDFPATGRTWASAFSIGTNGYLLFGRDSNNFAHYDVWKFGSTATNVFSGNKDKNIISKPFPNPASVSTKINFVLKEGATEGEIILYNQSLKEVYRYKVYGSEKYIQILVDRFSNGIYYYSLQSRNHFSEYQKLIILK